jgi:hypothetical protein
LRRRPLILISHSAVYSLDVRGGRSVTAGYDGGAALVDLASGQIVGRYDTYDQPIEVLLAELARHGTRR